MTTSAEEALLVLRAQYDDTDALELLLPQCSTVVAPLPATSGGPRRRGRSPAGVLVLIYRKLRWLDNPEVFRPWAFRIASRLAFRHLRKRKGRPANVGEEALEHVVRRNFTARPPQPTSDPESVW